MVRRPRALGALVLVLALVVSACGPGGTTAEVGSTAASVDGRVIEREPLAEDVRAVVESQPDLDAAAVQRQLLTLEILNALAAGIIEERGLTVSDEDRAAVSDTILATLGQDDAAIDAALLERGLTRAFFDRVYVPFFAAGNVIAYDLAEGRTIERREARHILVETVEEAEAILVELEAGADFAELAAERSQDPGSAAQGGSLGLNERGVFVDEFEAFVWTAELEELSRPVETQFGFHVIQVLQIEERPASELSPQEVLNFVGAEVQEVIQGALDAATITVAPGLGVWDTVTDQVVAEPAVGETP